MMMIIMIMETMVILVYIHKDGRFKCLWQHYYITDLLQNPVGPGA